MIGTYPGQCLWTRMCWSWDWCILHELVRCGRIPGRHRYTPADTPAQAPPPSQTVSQGWAAGSRNAATMQEEKENVKALGWFQSARLRIYLIVWIVGERLGQLSVLTEGHKQVYNRNHQSSHSCLSLCYDYCYEAPNLSIPVTFLFEFRTLMSMNLCMGSYHCSSTTLDSRPQHKNTQPRCRFSAAAERRRNWRRCRHGLVTFGYWFIGNRLVKE